MRILSTLKNSIYAIVSYLILAVLALLVRKVFLDTFPVEILGYEGLFGNIFGLLALADLGIETLILYRMFPAFANNEKEKINKNMAVYRSLYRYVGFFILIIGVALIPFLKYIVNGNQLNWTYMYVIYCVQLMITLCTYFLAYKRLMFTVSQQEFECTKVDTSVGVFFNLVKIIVLIVFKNYILYLLCNLAVNLLSNYIISRKVDVRFDYLESNYKASMDEVKNLGIGKEIKDNLVQKVSGTIYGGTDNIVISILLGINKVGLMSNYNLICGFVTTFTTKLLKPFQMSIGNHIYSSDNKSGYELFRMFDYLSFTIASIISTCYLCVFNPFIEVWLGDSFLLPQSFVLVFSLNQFVAWNHQFLCYYRYSFGRYELDKYPILVAAIVNVALSIVLCKPLGVTGIMLGTLVGQIGFWIGRVRVIYTVYINNESVCTYIVRQGVRLVVLLFAMCVAWRISLRLQINVFGILGRILISVLIPVVLNVVAFGRTSEMRNVKDYIKKSVELVKQRGYVK